jgi:hypothetical protein
MVRRSTKPRGRPYKKGNKKPEGSGRAPGTLNHRTVFVKNMLEEAVLSLGGLDRLLWWVKKDPANEYAFWTILYPKLIPLQIQGSGKVDLSVTIKHEELVSKLVEHGLPPTLFGAEVPMIEDMRVINGNGNGDARDDPAATGGDD